jgi:hypothetical protein
VERLPGLRRDQVSGCAAGLGGGTTVSGGEVELLEPGWVPTKMGGSGAPDDFDKAHRTQVWLATSDEPAAAVSGRYFFHQKLRDPDPPTNDIERQGLLLDWCQKVPGSALRKS